MASQKMAWPYRWKGLNITLVIPSIMETTQTSDEVKTAVFTVSPSFTSSPDFKGKHDSQTSTTDTLSSSNAAQITTFTLHSPTTAHTIVSNNTPMTSKSPESPTRDQSSITSSHHSVSTTPASTQGLTSQLYTSRETNTITLGTIQETSQYFLNSSTSKLPGVSTAITGIPTSSVDSLGVIESGSVTMHTNAELSTGLGNTSKTSLQLATQSSFIVVPTAAPPNWQDPFATKDEPHPATSIVSTALGAVGGSVMFVILMIIVAKKYKLMRQRRQIQHISLPRKTHDTLGWD